jgi:DNA-binding NarL/FixJ family response regulator
MKQFIRVFTVDDHEIFRKGLNMILQQIPDVKICGEASNGREFLDKLDPAALPDLILTDIRMPVMDGIQATKEALHRFPNLKIVAISMFGEENYLEQMLGAGVKGFLLKSIGKPELARAIQSICQGQQYYSAELLPYFTQKFLAPPNQPGDPSRFSTRELDILKLVARGLTSQEIGDALFISKRTVEGHKANMIEKTGSRNIVDLIVYAIKNELVRID